MFAISQPETSQTFPRYPELERHSEHMRNKLREFYKKWPQAKKPKRTFMERMSFGSNDMQGITYDTNDMQDITFEMPH
jgi:hypothetical protein